MSGYKRVNFYELCRLCATSQHRRKTHIFHDEGKKIHLQNKIQSCLSLTVYEHDFLPKVVCSTCLKTLELCYTFKQDCTASESMLSSYFKNFRYTEDFKKSGKVYIKDDAPKLVAPEEDNPNVLNHSTSQASTSGTYAATQNISVSESKQSIQSTHSLEHNPYYAVQLPMLVTQQNYSSESKTAIKDDEAVPQAVQTKIMSNNIPHYNFNPHNLGSMKPPVQNVPKNTSENEHVNNVVINSNGEVLNITHMVDIESINQDIASKMKVKQKVVKEKPILKIDLTQSEVTKTFNSTQLDTKYEKVSHTHTKNAQNKYSYSIKVDEKTSANPGVIFSTMNEYNHVNNANGSSVTNFHSYESENTMYNSSQVSNTNITSSNNNISEPCTVNLNVISSNVSDLSSSTSVANYRTLQNTCIAVSSSKTSVLQNLSVTTSDVSTISSNASVKRSLPESCSSNHNPMNIKLFPEKLHVCEMCRKRFKRREHLYQHIKLHTGFRPYTCENCNKSFMRKEHLLRHMISHSGLKNFTCSICEKSFSRNDNLLKHKKTHEKQSSFTCEICQKQFVMKHYYIAHKMTHENEQKYEIPKNWSLIKT